MNDAALDPRAELDAVPARGYRWWYVDGLSDDGRRGFTIIYMYGSVFSPWRALRTRRGEPAAAAEHLGIHIALYEDEREVAWTMSEYAAGSCDAARDRVRLGGSTLTYAADGTITGSIVERSAPIFWSRLGIGSALRGRFTLSPAAARSETVALGRSALGDLHHWQVRAPIGRIEVEFDRPRFRFSGRGYHDTNWGDGRLDEAFTRWSWARFHSPDRSRILYGVEGRDRSTRGFLLEAGKERPTVVGADHTVRFGAPESTGWGLSAPRGFALGDAARADVVRWLDRTPFYARYVARHDEIDGVGEYLDLDRFQRREVQFLLRWRGQRYR